MSNCDDHNKKTEYCEDCVEAAIIGYVGQYYGTMEAIKVINRLNEDAPTEGYN